MKHHIGYTKYCLVSVYCITYKRRFHFSRLKTFVLINNIYFRCLDHIEKTFQTAVEIQNKHIK